MTPSYFTADSLTRERSVPASDGPAGSREPTPRHDARPAPFLETSSREPIDARAFAWASPRVLGLCPLVRQSSQESWNRYA